MDWIGDCLKHIWDWIVINHDKIIWLVVVVVVCSLLEYACSRMLRKSLERVKMPNASIFINLLRVLFILLAFALVLQPVFGISPMSVFTALGIGGFALSLGLKDSVANIISGFELMFSHVLQPGDIVTISGITGTVQDVTWRQTVVREPNGNLMMIPNSVLNTTALEKIDPVNQQMVSVPFTAKPGVDTNELKHKLLEATRQAAGAMMNPNRPPMIQFTGFTPYGITGNINAYAKKDGNKSMLVDTITRAISESDLVKNITNADAPKPEEEAPAA